MARRRMAAGGAARPMRRPRRVWGVQHRACATPDMPLTMHGKGAGDDGPIITGASREKRHMAYELKANMTFIFKPSASTADGNSLCTWGDTVVITDKGARRLGSRPHDLCVSGT